MQQHVQNLENWLDSQYKKLPALPKGGKNFLVDVAPWLALLGGIFNIIAAWRLYDWAHSVSKLVDYANDFSRALGVEPAASIDRWSVGVWLALIVTAVTGVVYLMAFSPLKDRKKAGWNLLFYALLLNLAYAVVLLFTDYGGGLSGLIGSVIGAAIGYYFLFQIRPRYSGASKAPTAPTTKKSEKA